jgi:hypothetical protein
MQPVRDLAARSVVLGQLVLERGAKREQRHFVLVLVRHELVRVPGDGLGRAAVAGRVRLFGLADPTQEIRAPACVLLVLVVDQVGDPGNEKVGQSRVLRGGAGQAGLGGDLSSPAAGGGGETGVHRAVAT